jgi:hypothetical protein
VAFPFLLRRHYHEPKPAYPSDPAYGHGANQKTTCALKELLAAQDVPTAKAVYEELKKRFPKVRRRCPLTDATGHSSEQ